MESKPKTSRRTMILTIMGVVLLVLIAAGFMAYPKIKQRWTAPLGASLDLPTHTPTVLLPASTSTQVIVTQPTRSEAETLTPSPEPTSTIELTATPKPLCSGPQQMILLAVGVDTEDDNYTYGLGDAIRIVRLDYVTPKVSVLSIPRDLWVEIPGISEHYGITHGKLNQSYFYGGPGMAYYDGPGGGPGLMARTLDLNFGVRVDHYGALNMITFSRIIDAIGGIDIYLPTDIDGTPIDNQTADMGYFYAGNNHFTGDEAMRFVRIRKRYNDMTRMDHQNMVICAIAKKLIQPEVLTKIPKVIEAFKGNVQTDLSLQQMSQMACLLPSLPRENIQFASLPGEIFTQGRMFSPQMRNETFILEVDFKVIRDYIQQFLAGTWPVPSSDSGGSFCK
jgi:LCP family protein required for cell wall assembly